VEHPRPWERLASTPVIHGKPMIETETPFTTLAGYELRCLSLAALDTTLEGVRRGSRLAS
jgi:hypothetical protein